MTQSDRKQSLTLNIHPPPSSQQLWNRQSYQSPPPFQPLTYYSPSCSAAVFGTWSGPARSRPSQHLRPNSTTCSLIFSYSHAPFLVAGILKVTGHPHRSTLALLPYSKAIKPPHMQINSGKEAKMLKFFSFFPLEMTVAYVHCWMPVL